MKLHHGNSAGDVFLAQLSNLLILEEESGFNPHATVLAATSLEFLVRALNDIVARKPVSTTQSSSH